MDLLMPEPFYEVYEPRIYDDVCPAPATLLALKLELNTSCALWHWLSMWAERALQKMTERKWSTDRKVAEWERSVEQAELAAHSPKNLTFHWLRSIYSPHSILSTLSVCTLLLLYIRLVTGSNWPNLLPI